MHQFLYHLKVLSFYLILYSVIIFFQPADNYEIEPVPTILNYYL